MDTDGSMVVDSDKLSRGLASLSVTIPFTAADVDEIIGSARAPANNGVGIRSSFSPVWICLWAIASL